MVTSNWWSVFQHWSGVCFTWFSASHERINTNEEKFSLDFLIDVGRWFLIFVCIRVMTNKRAGKTKEKKNKRRRKEKSRFNVPVDRMLSKLTSFWIYNQRTSAVSFRILISTRQTLARASIAFAIYRWVETAVIHWRTKVSRNPSKQFVSKEDKTDFFLEVRDNDQSTAHQHGSSGDESTATTTQNYTDQSTTSVSLNYSSTTTTSNTGSSNNRGKSSW